MVTLVALIFVANGMIPAYLAVVVAIAEAVCFWNGRT